MTSPEILDTLFAWFLSQDTTPTAGEIRKYVRGYCFGKPEHVRADVERELLARIDALDGSFCLTAETLQKVLVKRTKRRGRCGH
jgi:hypothetical protein